MRIEEFPGELGGGGDSVEELLPLRREGGGVAAVKGEEEGGVVMRVAVDAKRAAVGVGARMLFYPTLMYNVVRNQFEAHFHWWDQVDEVGQFSSPFWFVIDFVPDMFLLSPSSISSTSLTAHPAPWACRWTN
jgi:hypothetical protein